MKCNKGNTNAILLEQYIERLKKKDLYQKELKRKAILDATGANHNCCHSNNDYVPDHFLNHALKDIKNFER